MKYSIRIAKRICIKKGDKHFGRRMFIIHLLKNKRVYKWFSIYPWRIKL